MAFTVTVLWGCSLHFSIHFLWERWQVFPRSQNPVLVKIFCNNCFISIEWARAHKAGCVSLFVHSVRKLSTEAVVRLEQSSRTLWPALSVPAYFPTHIVPLPQFLHLFHILVLTAVMYVSPEKGIVNTFTSRDFFFLGDTCSWHIPLCSRNKLKWKIKNMRRHQCQCSNTDSQQNWLQHHCKDWRSCS